MGGGNSHQRKMSKKARERMANDVAELVVTRISKTSKESSVSENHNTLSTEMLLVVVGLIFTVVGLRDMFPLWMNILFCAMGLILFSWALWKWEGFKIWRGWEKALLIFGFNLLYCSCLVYPIKQQYDREIKISLVFKESPQFTWWRKQVITHDFAKLRDYFISLDIPCPPEFPPIGVQDAGNTGSNNPPGFPLYRTEELIGNDRVKDRMVVTSIYTDTVIWDYLAKNSKWVNSGGDLIRFKIICETFSFYYNGSYWNKEPIEMMPILIPLWKIHEELGADFTDKLVSYAIRSIADNPTEGWDQDIRIYLSRKLKIGDSIVENDMSKWPEIAKILKDGGVPIDRL
jgi:hypothetical protein